MTRQDGLPIPCAVVSRADALEVAGHSWSFISIVVGVRAERIRRAVLLARCRTHRGLPEPPKGLP
ncbi:MAG TPA: hypothetical protein VMH38_05125 [Thermoplasmata archaeon]|nr:hypothetical protein [Thermoplasmata archaeon]